MGAEVPLQPFSLDPSRLADKKITIMGLGRFGGGVGAARFFTERSSKVIVTDTAKPETLSDSVAALGDLPKITFHLGEHRKEDFTGADVVVVNPAVAWDSPFLALANGAGALLTSEMNIFLRMCPAKIVGVTGSNGKSTTTAMIGSIFSAGQKAGQGNFGRVFVGGNIGHSLLGEIEQITANDIVVLELSSFQLEALEVEGISPHIGVWTNFSANHLDRHKTIETYRRAKENIYRFQGSDDVLIYNGDDPGLEFLGSAAEGQSSRLRFSLGDATADAYVAEGYLQLRYRPSGRVEKVLHIKDMPVRGEHNVANALAAGCVGVQFNLGPEIVTKGLASFRPLPHRMELVTTIEGVSYYDDSIATTPESALVGLNSFDEAPIIILGGKDKGADFSMLLSACIEKCYGVICLGQVRDNLIGRLLNMRGPKQLPHIIGVDSLEEAVLSAASLAKPGRVVLLSPACASYDMFVNFDHRGRRFAEIVRGLP